MSRNGHTYFVTVLDSGYRYAHTIPIRTNSQAKNDIKNLLHHISRTSPHNPFLLLSDNSK